MRQDPSIEGRYHAIRQAVSAEIREAMEGRTIREIRRRIGELEAKLGRMGLRREQWDRIQALEARVQHLYDLRYEELQEQYEQAVEQSKANSKLAGHILRGMAFRDGDNFAPDGSEPSWTFVEGRNAAEDDEEEYPAKLVLEATLQSEQEVEQSEPEREGIKVVAYRWRKGGGVPWSYGGVGTPDAMATECEPLARKEDAEREIANLVQAKERAEREAIQWRQQAKGWKMVADGNRRERDEASGEEGRGRPRPIPDHASGRKAIEPDYGEAMKRGLADPAPEASEGYVERLRGAPEAEAEENGEDRVRSVLNERPHMRPSGSEGGGAEITVRERLPGRWEARQEDRSVWAPTPEEAVRVLRQAAAADPHPGEGDE